MFEREAARIRAALGERALMIEHVGSTSVPGLAAKPRIDILLVLADTSDESTYVPDLEAAGYVLRIREPEWYEHRMFNGPDIDLNLHVLPAGCEEVERMLLFRDHLRRDDADRALYQRTKRSVGSARMALSAGLRRRQDAGGGRDHGAGHGGEGSSFRQLRPHQR